jgi:DNA-binding NarL/FixJ family response regulator
MNPTRVLVAEDLQIVRDGFIAILQDSFDYLEAYATSSCKETIDVCGRMNFDVAILDINLGDGSALDIIPAISESTENIKILVLSATTNLKTVLKALELGAHGFISKFSSKDEFIFAVKSVLNSKKYICSNTIDLFIKEGAHCNTLSSGDPSIVLSNRELSIAKEISNGKTSKEIAQDLGISFTTVNKHRNNILKKLKINSSKHLRRYFASPNSDVGN